MNFFTVIEKFNNSKFKSVTEKVFSSYAFPFVTAAVAALFVSLKLETVLVWYLCLCGVGIALCCKEVSPAICVIIFMQQGVFSTVDSAVAAIILACAAVYRIVLAGIKGKIKITPALICLGVYAITLVFNGAFADSGSTKGTLYALIIAIMTFFAYLCFSTNVASGEGVHKHLAYTLLALCLDLAIQLLVVYLKFGVIHDGAIYRYSIVFSWGTYNQFGMFITMCVPAWFYLATKYKYGSLFLIGVWFNAFIVIMCSSRQAILASGVLIIACTIWYLIVAKKWQKLYGGIIIFLLALTIILLVCVDKDWFAYVFATLINSFSSGSGRTEIWKDGIKGFLNNPIFGSGFYAMSGEGLLPAMCHNTFIQLLFSCGLVGFIAYLAHRAQTLASLFINPNQNRIFVAFVIAAILLTSLLDNHLFYHFPCIVYAGILGLFSASEKAEKNQTQQENTKTEEVVCNDQEVDC